METPIAVANYFVNKSIYNGIELTPMKLLKLVYLAHGWNLGLKNEPLLAEAVQAWKFGPVIKSVYDSFKIFNSCQGTSINYSFCLYMFKPGTNKEY